MKRRRRRLPYALALASCAACGSIPAFADDEFSSVGFADGAGAARHGSVSLALQSLHTSGLILQTGANNHGAITDTQSVRLAVDYMLDDDWELHVVVPYIRKRSLNDRGNHDPLKTVPPHPESGFIDDGDYHATVQDLQIGVSRHYQFGSYHFEPHAMLTWPSHDYVFFANAAVGQHLKKLKLGVDIEHQFEGTNLYYSAGYSYELTEKVMGVHLNKQHLRASAGYMLDPDWSIQAFAMMRRGQGRDTSFFNGRTDEYWYQHDRLSRHNYAIAGVGASWHVNDRYTLSATAGKMIWGRTVHELKRAYELELSRGF